MLIYIASSIVPIAIIYILFSGMKVKQDALRLFADGVEEGLKIVLKVFPYVFAITIASNLIRDTQTIDLLTAPLTPILKRLSIPKGVIPLILLRPMSGSASIALVLDIIKTFGVNSIEGKLAAVIMGGTETTLYVVTVLLGSTGIKKYRGTIFACVLSDIMAIILSIILLKIGII